MQEIAQTFGVDWPHLLSQIVSFAIVCVVLQRLAYKPILAMLETRRRQIADGIANAAKIRAELDSIESSRQKILADAGEEGRHLLEDARHAAARLEARETDSARRRAEALVANAQDTAALERTRVLAEARHEIGRLVVQTAAAVTGKVLTPDDHRRLEEETALRLGAR